MPQWLALIEQASGTNNQFAPAKFRSFSFKGTPALKNDDAANEHKEAALTVISHLVSFTEVELRLCSVSGSVWCCVCFLLCQLISKFYKYVSPQAPRKCAEILAKWAIDTYRRLRLYLLCIQGWAQISHKIWERYTETDQKF